MKRLFKQNQSSYLQLLGVLIVCLSNLLLGNVVKKYPNFTFYSINRDHFIDLCQDLDILGIPSFVSYENGQETGRFVSKLRKTQEEIETFIQSIK